MTQTHQYRAPQQTPRSLTNLEEVSAPGVLLNKQVVTALQRTPEPERSALINKLASESAMARVLEKAMLVRRLLLSGMREPNVANSPAPKHILETLRHPGSGNQECVVRETYSH